MTTQAVPVSGQDIGVAARAVNAVLLALLDEIGATYPEWIALRTLTQDGPAARNALLGVLAGRLDTTVEETGELLDRLGSAELVRQGDRVELTAAGRVRYERLLAEVGRVSAPLYRGLDPEDLATARRVLVTVTERARAAVSR
jgi:DNA-binding MarR family transcriptional regulator